MGDGAIEDFGPGEEFDINMDNNAPDPEVIQIQLPPRKFADEGVDVMDFPWTEAHALKSSFNTAIHNFTRAMAVRGNKIPDTINAGPDHVAWSGGYREDFNVEFQTLLDEHDGLLDRLGTLGQGLVDAANDANSWQITKNEQGPDDEDDADDDDDD